MSWGERKRQQNLIFDQTCYIEFRICLDHVGRFRIIHIVVRLCAGCDEQQNVRDVNGVIEQSKATLTLQMQPTCNAQLELGPITRAAATAHLVAHRAFRIEQDVVEPRQACYRYAALQRLLGPRKLKTVDHRRCRHKRRMIVFLPFPVKTKTRKPQFLQALRSITAASTVLLLASSSRYRRTLLERLGLPFSCTSPDIDESILEGEHPQATALRLAESKARAIAAAYPDAYIIGSDQVAVLDSHPLGKPGTHDAALAQLLAICGRSVVFHTAVCLLDARSGRCHVEEVPTTVHFRQYTVVQAARYLDIDKPYDCAGSAKIESLGIALVESVESTDPTALIGLPLIVLVSMLKSVGVEVL